MLRAGLGSYTHIISLQPCSAGLVPLKQMQKLRKDSLLPCLLLTAVRLV